VASPTRTPVTSTRHPVLDRVGYGATAASPDCRSSDQPTMRLARGQSRSPARWTVAPSHGATPLIETATSSPSSRLVEVLKDSALEGTGNQNVSAGLSPNTFRVNEVRAAQAPPALIDGPAFRLPCVR